MSNRVDLEEPIERGDTFAFKFIWSDDDGPIDMRGKTLLFSIKLSPFIPDEEASILMEIVPEMDDPLAEEGTVTITVPKSLSENLIAGATHHYALRVREPGYPEPIETTHVYGEVRVKDS